MSDDEAALLQEPLQLASLGMTFCLTDEYNRAYGVSIRLEPTNDPKGAHATFEELSDDTGEGMSIALHAVPSGVVEFEENLQAAVLLHIALAALSFQEGYEPSGARTDERFNRTLAWLSAGAEKGVRLN